MTSSTGYYLGRAGVGISTLVHVGGDAIVGMRQAQILRLFEQDPDTRLVVLFGEIGTSQEEEVADLIQAGDFTKPVIAYIGGKAAKSGTRFSHAGAIVEAGRGTYEGKVARLREVGVHVVDSFAKIPEVARTMLDGSTLRQKSPERDAENLNWKTAITRIEPNEIRLRGYRLDELMGQVSFAQAIYLALTGNLPSPQVGVLLDAMLVSSIDHGATPPSALAARTAASTGAPLNAAVAVGILSINKHHGGAIEDAMRMLLDVLKRADEEHIGNSIQQAAEMLVTAYNAEKKRLPGFGHRVHTDDPRTGRLLELAESAGVAGRGVGSLRALESALAAQGKRLPANVDGAIAALLVDLGLPVELANAFFILARVPGLVAQVHEEMTRERPMRRIHPTDQTYDGPAPRQLPDAEQ